MKKYNLSQIMKKAWETYRKFQGFATKLSFSECLRRAWTEAKKAVETVAVVTLDTIKAAAHKLVMSGDYEEVSFKEWNGCDKSRVYIKAVRHTLAGNLRTADCGYWDVDNSKYVPQAIDLIA
ncbi:hypothetical protein [Hungatella effluvii]|uniref:hypothetical protein n=1 Tax=Hungatella effluvii TaxID=1096246 RepID=UPI002A8269F7|nr:hypothetical protein [Hungatella effluvii]